jgi:hypothetical protein
MISGLVAAGNYRLRRAKHTLDSETSNTLCMLYFTGAFFILLFFFYYTQTTDVYGT